MRNHARLAAAAMIAATGAIAAVSIGATMGQPETRPGLGQPAVRPAQTTTIVTERLFSLEGPMAERQLVQLAERLKDLERQMEQANTQLSQRLQQAREADGDQKVDQILSALELVANEHEQMHHYLVELRTALTGPADSIGAPPGQPPRRTDPPRREDPPRRDDPPGRTDPR